MQTKPAIRFASRGQSTFYAALHYAELGMSVLPCNGKLPAIDWRSLQTRRASFPQIERWDDLHLFGNVGIIAGAVSGNLVIIDLDGDAAVTAFETEFHDLTDTYSVASGSGHGRHIYLYTDRLMPTTRVTGCAYGNIELRSTGCYVIAPPSIHPNGKPYTIHNPTEIARLPHLDRVVDWIKDLMKQKHGGSMPAATNAGVVRQASPWAAAALRDEARKVAATNQGGANIQLNRSAFKLGQIIAKGAIDRVQVENTLLAAAAGLSARDGEAATRRTIKSGIDAGMNNPRKS